MRTKRIAITVRFSPEEKEKTEKNAAEVKASVSRFLARTGSQNRQPVSREERELLAKLIVQLNHLGNNVNQLTTATNLARKSGEPLPDEFRFEQAGLLIISLVSEIKERIKL
jgi:membrane-bound lytic murein transglycosylase B